MRFDCKAQGSASRNYFEGQGPLEAYSPLPTTGLHPHQKTLQSEADVAIMPSSRQRKMAVVGSRSVGKLLQYHIETRADQH